MYVVVKDRPRTLENLARKTRHGARSAAGLLAVRKGRPTVRYYVCLLELGLVNETWSADLTPVDMIWWDGTKLQQRSLDNPDP